ncbi:hypothetical protein JCM10213_007376 [Rhodosporidiobolus nylandii]
MGLRSWARNEWHEAKDAGKEIWHFVRTHNWKKTAKNSFKRKYWLWWIVGILACVAIGLISFYRDTIVAKFEPHKDAIVNFPASWVIPIAVLVILSFPPLGGHEIVLLVVGLIWGVWIGFAIACAGTLIGEVLCFYLFKYLLTNKAASIERESVFYACIARLMRNGGLWIIIVVRFSAIPGHVVTAIQSTVGMNIFIYIIAIVVSLPKQLAVVWLGEMFGETEGVSDPATVKKQQRISLSVFFATCVATLLSLYIVYMRARKLYPEVLRDMEAANGGIAGAAGSKSSLSQDDHEPTLPTHHRRDSFVEAAFEGDPSGVSYVAPLNRTQGAHPMVRTNTGGTWRSSMDEDEFRSPAQKAQQGAWQDGGAWSSVEARERAQAEQDQRRERLGYGQLPSESQQSFSHLPLASESEVGISSRPALPQYPSRSSPADNPYRDPFANPSSASLASTGAPYGTAPYNAGPSSSSVNIPLQPPPSGPSRSQTQQPPASIPYLAPPPGSPSGRPISVGGTEIMTGVGAAGGLGARAGQGGGGGRYDASGGR